MNEASRVSTTKNSKESLLSTPALDRYRRLFACEGITEEQVDACLTSLWEIMVRFVDLGFDFKTIPSHFALSTDKMAGGSPLMVSSSDPVETEEGER